MHLSQNLDDKEWFFLSTMETQQEDCPFLCPLSINFEILENQEGTWNPHVIFSQAGLLVFKSIRDTQLSQEREQCLLGKQTQLG